jgi:hypothetical protein
VRNSARDPPWQNTAEAEKFQLAAAAAHDPDNREAVFLSGKRITLARTTIQGAMAIWPNPVGGWTRLPAGSDAGVAASP